MKEQNETVTGNVGLEIYFNSNKNEKADRKSCVHIVCCMNKLCKKELSDDFTVQELSLEHHKLSRHLDMLRKSLYLYSAHYENTILLGDFNVNIDDPNMESFCESHRFKRLIRDPTGFKNTENSSCIDLILTNRPYSFKTSCVIETGLSDSHMMIVLVMKTFGFSKIET